MSIEKDLFIYIIIRNIVFVYSVLQIVFILFPVFTINNITVKRSPVKSEKKQCI